jgi:hypothetical protein
MAHSCKFDRLKTDLSNVNALLVSRGEEDDPVGYFQFLALQPRLRASKN